MAVDSREKRASAFSSSWDTQFPLPDGSVGKRDRVQAAGVYSGITAGAPEVLFSYDGRVTHMTVVDEAVTGARDQHVYVNHMNWEDRP